MAVWILPAGPADRDTFQLTFRARVANDRVSLDLLGFDRGFLRGRTLFCIAEVREPTMRMDCEPGGERDAFRRPTAFTTQTRSYVRSRDHAGRGPRIDRDYLPCDRVASVEMHF